MKQEELDNIEVSEIEKLEYALFGMNAKISFLERECRKGKRLLKGRANHEEDNSPFNDDEIADKISELEEKIEVLEAKVKILTWEFMIEDGK